MEGTWPYLGDANFEFHVIPCHELEHCDIKSFSCISAVQYVCEIPYSNPYFSIS